MWEYEHRIHAIATPAAIWEAWADVPRWGDWHADIDEIHLDGAFVEGSTITMHPRGQEAVRLRIDCVEENVQFVDVAEVGGMVIRTVHRIDPIDDDHVQVTYRTEITGDGGAEIGPGITADFPETMQALVQYAAR